MNEKNVAPADRWRMEETHAILAGVGLPRARVEGERYEFKVGPAWVSIQAGCLDTDFCSGLQLIPYGPMARLILAWVSTFALRHKRQDVPIGEAPDQYLHLMGFDSGKYDPTALREQMHALAACRIQYGCKGRTYSAQPFVMIDAWPRLTTPRAVSPGPHELVLSDEYYRSLLASGTPLDYRALDVLSDSSLALDIYVWLSYRLPRLRDKDVTVPWGGLYAEFGREFRREDFVAAFSGELERVRAVYPQAQVKLVTGGVMLTSSPPPVPYEREVAA